MTSTSMENLDFKSRDELKKYLDAHFVRKLGQGKHGVCTLLDTGVVAKLFHEEEGIDWVLKFKDFDIPSFQFAKAVATVDGFAHASFAKPARGTALNKRVPLNKDMVLVGKHMQRLSNDIQLAGDKGICVNDFFEGNIVYDGRKFTVIDTLPYAYYTFMRYATKNLTEIIPDVYKLLLDKFICIGPLLDMLYVGDEEAYKNPAEYLKALRDRVRELTGEEVNTFEEANLAMRRKYYKN